MSTGDFITVLGRYDVGRITAIETGPDWRNDQPVEFVCAEFADGVFMFHPWEITGVRSSNVIGSGPGNIREIVENRTQEPYQE